MDQTSHDEIRAMADKQTTPHKIEIGEPVEIWGGDALPKTADIPLLEGVEFHVIKKQRPDTDGCRWTLGVGLAWHKGKLCIGYTHKSHAAHELAIIPIRSLEIKP